MFRLPRYSDMRVAGGWLDRIPTHWDWDPARTLFAERKQTRFEGEPLLSVTIGRGVLPQADFLATTSKKDSSNTDKSKYKLVVPGDLVYNKMRAWQGAAGLSQHRGIVSPAYVVMTPRRGQAPYFHYIVRTPMFAKEAERWSYGITSDQWSLRPEHFKMIRFPVPPADEQAAIVKYLAHANARIDKAIAAKRRLIALLGERQRAVVRESLDGSRWEPWPLGRLGRLGNGSTPSRSEPAYWNGDVPWLNSSVVNRSVVDSADQFVTSRALVECHLPMVPAGSVLIGITGQGKTRGMATVLRIEAAINQHLAFLTPDPRRASAEYLRFALAAGYDELRRLSDGSGGTKGALTLADLKSYRVPLPPLDAQASLLRELSASARETEQTVVRVNREIDLLKEFRTRLVSDVVTGQVDVLGLAASLPELPVALEAVDPTEDADELEIDDTAEKSGGLSDAVERRES
ncbi:MAG TPA: restriction endonuclease subunit S [Marmoricola sp.]|nr:restriction endonuclease subunit S [Marmoricola sp.]